MSDSNKPSIPCIDCEYYRGHVSTTKGQLNNTQQVVRIWCMACGGRGPETRPPSECQHFNECKRWKHAKKADRRKSRLEQSGQGSGRFLPIN